MTRVGLVLGGGGINGYAFHTAALRAIEEATGWDPRTADIILGTSAGSGAAAILRGGVSTEALFERLNTIPGDTIAMNRLYRIAGRDDGLIPRFWKGPAAPMLAVKEALRGPRARPLMLLSGLLPEGKVRTEAVGEPNTRLHDTRWPERALWITAMSLATGQRVVFGTEETSMTVGQAVEASCAIPGYFTPVVIDGVRYIDGGMESATNADLLADQGLDLVIALSPMSSSELRMTHPISAAVRALPTRQLRDELALVQASGTATLAIEPDLDIIGTMGPNPMSPNRIISVLAHARAHVDWRMRNTVPQETLDLLSAAATSAPPVTDHPYPYATA